VRVIPFRVRPIALIMRCGATGGKTQRRHRGGVALAKSGPGLGGASLMIRFHPDRLVGRSAMNIAGKSRREVMYLGNRNTAPVPAEAASTY
jgi:hypothetical protein